MEFSHQAGALLWTLTWNAPSNGFDLVPLALRALGTSQLLKSDSVAPRPTPMEYSESPKDVPPSCKIYWTLSDFPETLREREREREREKTDYRISRKFCHLLFRLGKMGTYSQ